MTPNIALIIQNAMKQRMAPPDPAAQMVAPQPNVPRGTPTAPDPLESQLMTLLNQKQGRDWSVPEIAPPRSANENDVGGRYFLSGLTHGWNQNQKARADKKESAIMNLLRLQEQKRYHDAQIGNMGSDNTRADAALESIKAQRDWAQQHGDSMLERSLAALEETIRSHKSNEGLRGLSINLTDERGRAGLALRATSEARKAAVSSAYAKLPPALKLKVDHMESLIQYNLNNKKGYEGDQAQADYDKMDEQILRWSQSAGTQSDDFGDPIAPGLRHGPAPEPTDPKGARANAGIRKMETGPSGAPKPTKKKGFLEGLFGGGNKPKTEEEILKDLQ